MDKELITVKKIEALNRLIEVNKDWVNGQELVDKARRKLDYLIGQI